jgi:hypothetical protein
MLLMELLQLELELGVGVEGVRNLRVVTRIEGRCAGRGCAACVVVCSLMAHVVFNGRLKEGL